MMKWIDTPPVWLLLALVVTWYLAALQPAIGFGIWAELIGGVLFFAGIAIVLVAAFEFRRAQTTIVPHEDARVLITGGLYRYSRNPIYLGDALILAGLILRWDAVLAVPVLPLFVFLIQRRFILPEEARLAAAFPSAFESYRASTRRWI